MMERSNQTFEEKNATKCLLSSPDPIHWDQSKTFRSSPYRFLQHQNGIIGNFNVRLVEAKELIRSHWSVLGLGPVKHLNLSNSHGEVSSYAEFKLGFRHGESGTSHHNNDVNDRKATNPSSESSSTTNYYGDVNDDNDDTNTTSERSMLYSKNEVFTSTTVNNNNHPKWSTVQTPSNKSVFDIPLRKGAMPYDGMKIFLSILMKEERTAADVLVPGIVKGGSDILGAAEIDLTCLVMRQSETDVDVFDEWIDLEYDDETNEMSSAAAHGGQNQKSDSNKGKTKIVGRVRLLISYEPNGHIPQRGDIVALETFARRQPTLSTSHLIVPPLAPLQILDVRGEYFLVSFDILSVDEEGNSRYTCKKGRVRLHRNTIFVIERKNIVDSAINLALKPADVVLSTPIGQEVSNIAQPYVEAGGELVMPVILSGRLLMEAAKVGGSAFWVGLKSATVAVVTSQDPERRRKASRSTYAEYPIS